MEAATVTSSSQVIEVNSVDACASEVPHKDEASVASEGGGLNSAAEPPQTAESAPADKELSWEKIAAEITENDAEEALEPETSAPQQLPVVFDAVINNSIEDEVIAEAASVDSAGEHVETSETPPATEEVPSQEAVAEPLPESEPIVEISNEVEEEPEATNEFVEEPEEFAPKKFEHVEITELKPEEVATEIVEDVEYTVVEADDAETNEIIEEHLAQSRTTTETVVIINPDQTETEIRIEQIQDSGKNDGNSQTYTEEIYVVSKDSESVDDPEEVRVVKPKKPRGRKPISDIPLHVLGRDINKPSEGVSNGGRTMPKPRLGVKVPYRNLTSQIVSKQEIEKEIMERFKFKQDQISTSSGDILFARKLTQRLAKKLTPTEKDKKEDNGAEKPQIVDAEIKNDSDLIAILEGEGDEIDLKKKAEVVKKTEKEIALQQLKELPISKNRVFIRPRDEEKEAKNRVVKPREEEKEAAEMEPRLKTGVVVKTYARKRKSTESETVVLPPKKSTIKSEDGGLPSNVYVTKSSRVIKRKVIWDPDEIPVKSSIKQESPAKRVEQNEKLPEKKIPVKKVEQSEKLPEKKIPVKKVEQNEKLPEKKIPAKKVEQNEKLPERKIPVKKITKSPPPKKPKRLTEVDRLLMDEGAVNMLYDVKTNDESSPKKKTTKSTISLDRAHKELMSKTSVIKNDLQQNTGKEQQKTLRKKEFPSPPKKEQAVPGVAATRKRSKDSSRSSVHSPPASPSFNAAEASRIIRRHSSSSFSSGEEASEEDGKKRAASAESPKKKMKKGGEAKPAKSGADGKANHVDRALDQYETFTTRKKNCLLKIQLNNVDGRCHFTEQVLKELTACLKECGKDDGCNVVSLTSDSPDSFCQGLDYRTLVADDDGIRKKKAAELASLVKEFLRCLLNFPKVLVAGIQGECVGLGVTMLPLFDLVVASDTSTFSTPYSRLGCVPEAAFLLTVPHINSHGLASELFYTPQVVKADDACRRGLVSRLCWPEKYAEELKSLLISIASQSRQSIVSSKQQLRHHLLQSTEAALSSATKVLVENWTSPECQKNFLNREK